MNDLPKGPVLLKDFGLRDDRWFKSGHASYKKDRIEAILKTYPQLKLVLIGDSGQHDVYAYLEIAKSHPDRVLAVYIRDLKASSRSKEITIAAKEFVDYGVPFMFVEDAAKAANHAVTLGLVSETAARNVEHSVANAQLAK
nr:App1 family protein [Salinimonas marina]